MIFHRSLQRIPRIGIVRLSPHHHHGYYCRRGQQQYRAFQLTGQAWAIKPFLLADIGEGIRECEVIQWFVEPEARVEQFDKLCEVQSDKASVEITSRYDGVVKKLHYEAGEMAIVGKPLVDIDVEESETAPPCPEETASTDADTRPERREQASIGHRSLATPAVRHLAKEQEVDIRQILGTGKGGRVLREDVLRYVEQRDTGSEAAATATTSPSSASSMISDDGRTDEDQEVEERIHPLTPNQQHMFKTMTRSLTIPHFLYADEYNLDALTRLRSRLNQEEAGHHSLTALPFIIKAISLSLQDFPLLNARLELSPSPQQQQQPPQLIFRRDHNIGIAISTAHGLVVPNIKRVQTKSVRQISADLHSLQDLATTNRLSPVDLAGGTFTVSNIGSLGGTYVAPVIVTDQVAIVGIGRARWVPGFSNDDNDNDDDDDNLRVVKKRVAHFSWSADHRVVDGAMVARMSERVRRWVERPEEMIVRLR